MRLTCRSAAVLAAALLLWPIGGPAQAEGGRGPVVVELFTSQGCSSCPPADEMLHYLAQRMDVIPLALHVDYWDYIGWKDSFALPQFTKRQRAYARAAGAHTIYTPQVVIGGQDHVIGNRPMEVSDQINRHKDLPQAVALSVVRRGASLRIEAAPVANAPDDGFAVQLVRYMPEQTVDILRGENAGRTITYRNIVTEWRTVARWSGKEALALDVDAPGDRPAVILVQQAGFGPILAAAVLR